MKNIKNTIKDLIEYNLVSVIFLLIVTVMIITSIVTVICLFSNGGHVDSDLINPANPSSPVHMVIK